jgi:hypothetical protein
VKRRAAGVEWLVAATSSRECPERYTVQPCPMSMRMAHSRVVRLSSGTSVSVGCHDLCIGVK